MGHPWGAPSFASRSDGTRLQPAADLNDLDEGVPSRVEAAAEPQVAGDLNVAGCLRGEDAGSAVAEIGPEHASVGALPSLHCEAEVVHAEKIANRRQRTGPPHERRLDRDRPRQQQYRGAPATVQKPLSKRFRNTVERVPLTACAPA